MKFGARLESDGVDKKCNLCVVKLEMIFDI